MKAVVLMLALLIGSQMRAQATFQVNAGSGNLLTGGPLVSGIGVTAYLPGNSIYTGLAVRDGHVLVGASDSFLFHDLKTIVGDQTIGISSGNVGIGLDLKGVSVHRRRDLCNSSKPCGWDFTAFMGATSGSGIFLPFEQYVSPQHIGAGILAQRSYKGFQISGLGVLEGGKKTLVGVGEYHFHQTFQATGSVGWLNNQKYAQALTSARLARIISLYASHSSFFQPIAARGDSVGATLSAGRFSMQGALNESSSMGVQVTGENVGAGIRVGWLSENSSWYKSSNQRSLLTHTATEHFRHLIISETVNQSAGKYSYSFGGGWSSNRFSVSLNHSIQFLLGGRGYQQVIGISFSIRIHDTIVSANTVTSPTTGKALWSVGGEQYIQASGLTLPGRETSSGFGKHVYSGVVQDERGQLVAGACLRIGKTLIYTDDMGAWQLRSRKDKAQSITVLVDEFQLGSWQLVTAPQTAKPGDSVVIVVKRIP